MVIHFLLLFFVIFNTLHAAYKDTSACCIYPLITKKVYDIEAEKFLTSVNSDFHDINKVVFAGEFGIKHTFSYNQKTQIKEFLDKRSVAAESILRGDEHVLENEKELFIDISKILYWDLVLSKRTSTLVERMTLCYPITLGSIFKRAGFNAKIGVPHIKELTLSEGFWKGSIRFSKAIKTIL